MSELAYTKGEWIIRKERNEKGITALSIFSDSKKFICSIRYIYDGDENEEFQGNAKLICQAPDMYEKLRQFIALEDAKVDTKRAWDDLIDDIKEILKKIES